MNREFWEDKTVLLTGHTGFKGSWLSIWLEKLGANVIGLSKDVPTTPSLFELSKISDNIRSIIDDIKNFDKVDEIVKNHKPEIVIHMAAQSLVRKSYQDPADTFSTNIMGTVNLLEAVRISEDTRVFINVTSDKCYANDGTVSTFTEDSPMGGYDPYSSSKGCSELVTAAYRNSFFNTDSFENHGLSLASVRAGNVIGGGDWAQDRLIPDVIRGISKKTAISIRNPNSVRPWQFVLDPLQGYISLAENMWSNGKQFAESWNFGPDENDCKPVRWILEKISSEWNEELVWEEDIKNNPHEANLLRLDCTKAKERLGWRSRLNLENSISWTINWYKEYLLGSDMREVTRRQIEEYMSL